MQTALRILSNSTFFFSAKQRIELAQRGLPPSLSLYIHMVQYQF